MKNWIFNIVLLALFGGIIAGTVFMFKENWDLALVLWLIGAIGGIVSGAFTLTTFGKEPQQKRYLGNNGVPANSFEDIASEDTDSSEVAASGVEASPTYSQYAANQVETEHDGTISPNARAQIDGFAEEKPSDKKFRYDSRLYGGWLLGVSVGLAAACIVGLFTPIDRKLLSFLD
jgi:hypothetical protein